MFWQVVCEQSLNKNGTTTINQQRENGKMSPKMDLTFIVRNPRVTKEEIPGFWTPWLMGIILSGTAQCFFKPSSSPTVSRVWARPFTQMYMISKIFETNTLRTCHEVNSQTWNFRCHQWSANCFSSSRSLYVAKIDDLKKELKEIEQRRVLEDQLQR